MDSDTQSQRRATWKDTLASLFKRRRTIDRGNSLGKIKFFFRNPQKFDKIFSCKRLERYFVSFCGLSMDMF